MSGGTRRQDCSHRNNRPKNKGQRRSGGTRHQFSANGYMAYFGFPVGDPQGWIKHDLRTLLWLMKFGASTLLQTYLAKCTHEPA